MKSVQQGNPKIFIISGSYPDIRCGVGDYVERLIENLVRKNMDVSLLTSSDTLVKRKKVINASIKSWNIFSLFKIASSIKRERPDLINLQIPTARYKAILNAISFLPTLSRILFKSTPFVVTIHDYSISRRSLRIFFLPLFLSSDAIIVTNEEDLKGIIKDHPFLKSKLKKIYMGPSIDIIDVADDKRREFYKKVDYKEGDRFITTSGFIKKDRHIDMIIKAFHKLSEEDDRLKLIILGDVQKTSDEKYRRDLFRLIEGLNSKGRIYLLGHCTSEEMSFYLSLSDLAILLYERGASFRRTTLINYLVRKIPIVTNIDARYDADDELINSGIVLTADSLRMDEICKKAQLVLYNAEYADNMKRKMEGLEKIFSWECNTAELLDIYSELMRKR